MNNATALDITLMIDTPAGVDAAPVWGTPYQFSASVIGAVTNDTIVAVDLGSYTNSDDDFVGWFVECVYSSQVANIGVRRQIVAHSEAVGVVTLTTETWPARTQVGDTYRMIDTTRCVPYVADDTGGSAAQMVDATRAETAATWVGSAAIGGPYLEVIEADNLASTTLRLITGSTALGVITATLGANTAIGDLAEILCCPEWEQQGFMTCTVEPLPRENTMGTYLTPMQARGKRSAQGQGALLFRGPGVAGDPGEADRIMTCALSAVGHGTLGTITVNDGAGAGTTVLTPFDAGTVTAGVLYGTAEGSVSVPISTEAAPNSVDWQVPLKVRAADNTVIRPLRTYTIPRQGKINHELYLKQYRGDGIVERIFSVVPRISFSGELNSFLRITSDFEGLDWERSYNTGRVWRGKRPTSAPFKIAGGRVTAYDPAAAAFTVYRFKSFSCTVGEKWGIIDEAHAPQGAVGHVLLGYAPTGQFVGYVPDSAPVSDARYLMEAYAPGTEMSDLLIQVGTRMGSPGVFAIYARKWQVVNCAISDDGGKLSYTIDWMATDYDTDTTSLPVFAVGMG